MRKKISYLISATLIILTTYMALLQLHNYIFPQADDWCRATKNISTFPDIIMTSLNEYTNWTGRFFITIFEYLILTNIVLWKYINPILIITLIILINVSSSKISILSKRGILQLLIIITLLFFLDLKISKEVLFWITGSINYLWPIVWLFIFIIIWMLSLKNVNKINKKYYYILPLFGVIVGCSHEQIGLIAIWFILITQFWTFVITKKVSSKFHFIVFLLIIISYLILLFAPGNIKRNIISPDGNAEYYLSSIQNKIFLRIHDILLIIHSFQSVVLAKLLLFISIIFNYFNGKKSEGKKKFSFILIITMLPYEFLLLFQFGNMQKWWNIDIPLLTFPQLFGNISAILIFSYGLWFINFLSILIYSIKLSIDKKFPRLLFFITSIFLSQVIMILAPYSPYRTFFITIVFYWCSLIYSISTLSNNALKYLSNAIMIYLVLLTLQNYQILKFNYKENFQINIANEKKIFKYLHNSKNSSLFLSKLPNEYFFDMPYIKDSLNKEWELICFKKYYGLNNSSTKIIWK